MPVANRDGASQGAIDKLYEICASGASVIRWLVFAIAVCAATNLLVLGIAYFGNVHYSIQRDEAVLAAAKAGRKPADEIKAIEDRLSVLREVRKEGLTAQIPLIGVTVAMPDFTVITGAFGILLVLWLLITLAFVRNTLANVFNDASLPGAPVAQAIPSAFVLLWPGGARRGTHRILFAMLLALQFSILAVLLSDAYDVLSEHGILGDDSIAAGWAPFARGMQIRSTVLLAELLLSGLLILGCQRKLRDVRNLLMLIEWDTRALDHAIKGLFDAAGLPLVEKANERTYEEYGSGRFRLHMEFTFTVPNETEPRIGSFSSTVDLWAAARAFEQTHRGENPYKGWMCSPQSRGARVGKETERLRAFFVGVLTSPDYERDLTQVFCKEVVLRHKIVPFMRRCLQAFPEKEREELLSEDRLQQYESGQSQDGIGSGSIAW